jgi:hypothetical protein
MFKWFAPLLLFVGKPEVIIRIVTLAIAGAVLFFGVYLLSNIALTFDALKSPYIIAAYGLLLFCFFVGIGTVAWLRLRRLAAPPQTVLSRQVAEAPPLGDEIVSRRAERMSRAWQRTEARAAEPAKRAPRTPSPPAPSVAQGPASAPVRAMLLVTGPAYTGKTALIGALTRSPGAGADDAGDRIRLVDGGPCEGDLPLDDLVKRAASSDGVLFVVDQDLRAPEVAAITRFIGAGKPLYVVLNKADQFSAADRDAILLSIRAKMPPRFPPGNVVSAAVAPSPVEREIEDARGTVRVELRRPSSDVAALTTLLRRVFPPAASQSLRFEAA